MENPSNEHWDKSGEGAFPFALLEKPHSEESWAGSLPPGEITFPEL